MVSNHVFDVPAHEVTLDVTLDREQRRMAEVVTDEGGRIQALVRSAIAQLGIDIDVDNIRLRHSTLEVQGHLLVTPNSAAERVMERMLRLHRLMELVVGRAMIIPHMSRLSREEVIREIDELRLNADGASVHENGSLLMPLQPDAHVFRTDQPSEEVLESILTGKKSGRQALQEVRTVGQRPSQLLPREFVVGEIDLHTRDCHVLLEPKTFDAAGNTTTAIHLGAFLLDAGRTQHSARHVELWNANGNTIDLDTLHVSAGVYRAGKILDPGI